MLKPTRAEIDAQAANLDTGDTLKVEDQKDVRALVRQHPAYTSADWPDLETKLEEVTGYEAQQILAAVAKIDALGQKLTSISVDQGLVTRTKDKERLNWVEFIMSVLYDGKEVGETTVVGLVADRTSAYWCSTCGGLCGCGRLVCP